MHRKRKFFEKFKKFSRSAHVWADFGADFAVIPRAPCRRCAPPLPETVRRALLIHVSAGSVGFADARRPRHDRADAAFARRRALPPLCIRQPSADCGFYLAIIRKRTTYTGAFFVVLRCSSAAVAHSDCPLAARLLHRSRHCRRFARPPQGEDTPFPKEKKRSGDFSEPLFIFDLPLPADSESRKVKKSPTVPCKARIRNPAFARLVSSLRFCAPNVLKICRKREVKGGLHPAGRSPDSINLSWV